MCPQRRQGEDPEFDPLTGLEQLFRAFVSKIAFLCCTEIGAGSISACAVLTLPDCVHIASILHLFAASQSESPEEREHRRVNGYLKALKAHLQECIKACQRESTQDSESTRNAMSQIQEALDACFETCQSELGRESRPAVNRFAVCDLISSLSRCIRSDTFADVRRRLAREDNMMSTTYWSDFVHVAGRLLSYKRAVDLMDEVSLIWPELFSNIQICMIGSSSPQPDVLSGKPWTAAQIMGRSTSDQQLLRLFAEQLDSLSIHDIDAKVSELWLNAPKPIVHAEVLVHSWLENTEGGIRPERFFNRWKFIGSSKPPCKLCSYFFDEYPTDVQVRPSHQNTYFPWRMPDIYGHQGAGSIVRQNLVMESIKARVKGPAASKSVEEMEEALDDPHEEVLLFKGRSAGLRDE
ncbi:hypothetical protein FBEOM_8675 [Fusarium beomiforme]|uniref:Uncharacterized protein n=1 Tax=Fusarium beomiforme TaxID=44412 RepID=A0A9P5AEU5_9HYPO|nr:hypothetical protein FBEOM_8675 [Fusarium beomiforme]